MSRSGTRYVWRRAKGPFRDVNDFAKHAGLSVAATAQLGDMIEAMAKVGAYARE